MTLTAIGGVRQGGGRFGCPVRTQLDAAGNPLGPDHLLMEGLTVGDAPPDSDGVPDDWETEHGLDPDDPAANQTVLLGTGYAEIESYISERAALLLWRAP